MRKILFVFCLLIGASGWACTDFSGEWKGICRKEGETQGTEGHQKWEQHGCDYIKTDYIPFEFGKEISFTMPSSEKEFDMTVFPQWDNKQETFTVKITVIERLLYPPKVSGKGASELFVRISNGRLLMEMNTVSTKFKPDNSVTTTHEKETCELQRIH